jgi:hypothetical protein
MSTLCFYKVRYESLQYNLPQMQEIAFKAPGHQITFELYQYPSDLMALLIKDYEFTCIRYNTVKDIDLQRLKDILYMIRLLSKQEGQVNF